METIYFIYLLLALSVVIIIAQFWIFKKSNKDFEDLFDGLEEEFKDSEQRMKKMDEDINSVNGLLQTYNKIITEKTAELEHYKNASIDSKQKGLFSSLISISEFIEKFNEDNLSLDEKTKNYLTAIQDKLEIALSSSGIEKFEPNLNENIMEVIGCTPSKITKKTTDSNKINLISSVIKPGYRILIRDDKFNYIKNAEVEIFELEKK
jgi:molecular chaperone GrpE (heat shock protein)